jgi:tape measure domain-containing protein
MPARVIDTAYVEIIPKVDQVDRAQRDVEESLREIGKVAESTSQDIDDYFRELEQIVDETFDEMARSANTDFDRITHEAGTTAMRVGEDFQAGGERSEEAFSELSRKAKSEMDEIERKSRTTAAESASSFKGMGLLGGAALAGIGAAATAGLGLLAKTGIQSAAALEQTQTSLNALTGSAEAGQAVFAELQKFAAATPFEFTDLAPAAARFLAFDDSVGLTDAQLMDFLTTIGNVISVTGGGADAFGRINLAIGQIGSSGKITLDNLNQIADAIPGFSPIAAIAQNLGITTAEAMDRVSAGSISATQGVAALLQGMRTFPGAAGAMEKQSQTLGGVLSTFADTFHQTLANAFAPAIPAIKDAVTQITPIIGDALGQIAPALGNVLTSVLPILGDLLKGIAPILTPILDGIASALAAVGPVLGPLGTAIGGILSAFKPLMPVIGQLITALATALVPVFAELAVAIEPIIPALIQVVEAVIPLLPALSELLVLIIQLLAPFIEWFVELSQPQLELFTKEVGWLAVALEAVVGWLEPVAKWMANIDWGETGRQIGSAFTTAWHAVENFFKGIFNWFTSLPGRVVDGIKALPRLLAQAFTDALKGVGVAIGIGIAAIIFTFTQLPTDLWNLLSKTLPEKIGDVFESLKNTITDHVTKTRDNLIQWATDLPGNIVDALKDLGSRVGNLFSTVWENAKTTVKNAIDTMIGWIRDLPQNLAGLATSVGGSIVQFFKNALNNAIGAINSGIAAVDDKLPGISLPRIPYLAHGGIAFGPALIGEDSSTSPEMALPLGDQRAMRMLVDALTQATGGSGAGGITVYVTIDGQQLQARIDKTVDQNNRDLFRGAR